MQKLLSLFTPFKKEKLEKRVEKKEEEVSKKIKEEKLYKEFLDRMEELSAPARVVNDFPVKVEDQSSYFTFKVHEVKQNKDDSVYLIPAEEMFRNQANCKTKLEDSSFQVGKEGELIDKEMNGVLNAIHFAYINHRPIKLSVSDFILMIGQGLAKHLEIHAEELRKYFVDFEGKEKIEILRPDLVPGKVNDWSTVFGQFSGEIKKRVKTDFYDVVIDDTSVATKITRISSEIALMDIYKYYFEFRVIGGCGFPTMTLVGTPEDWEMLRTKVRRLKELNDGDKLKLDWWLEKLIPLVETMVDQAKTREVDPAFWGSIYDSEAHGGSYFPTPLISGWINVFQPYLQRPKRDGNYGDTETYRSDFGDINPKNLITGISKISFTWVDPLEREIPMNFFGGFLGAKMLKDGTIEPEYFYAVAYDEE